MKILETCSKTYYHFISSQDCRTQLAQAASFFQDSLSHLKEVVPFPHIQLSLEKINGYKHLVEIFDRTIKTISTYSKRLNSELQKSMRFVYEVALKVFNQLDNYKAFIIGPAVSFSVASVVRLSLGKRVPTAGPLYISVFIALAALITVWAVQFFKHPKNQKMVQDKGVAGAIVHAIPFAKPRLIEPLHSRNFINHDRLEMLLQKPGSLVKETISEADAKGVFNGFKLYCDWVKKKIKLATANADTLAILKKTLVQHFIMTLKNIVINGNGTLIKEFIAFESQDLFVTKLLSVEERTAIYYQFGSRLSFLLNNPEIATLFPEPPVLDLTISCMDAIMAGNSERVIDLTNKGGVDATKVILYGDSSDLLLNKLNFKLPPMNLIQGAIIMGDVQSLQRILASLSSPIDWYQTDSRGLNLLVLAALSGSKPMWDFVREFYRNLPKVDSQDYLYLLYASMKGKNLAVFNELIQFSFEDTHKDLVGAMILDLYEKSLAFAADEFTTKLYTHEVLESQIAKSTSIRSILVSAIRGGKVDVVSKNIKHLRKVEAESALLLKELYEQACRSEKPLNEIFSVLRDYEASYGDVYIPAVLDIHSQDLASCSASLDDNQLKFVLSRLPKEQIVRYISEHGLFFQRLIRRHEVLAFVVEKCSSEKFLKVACAKEAIKMYQPDTLRMLCESGIDTVKKMPDSNESLLSYAMLSFKPDIIQIILSTCPPLSSTLLAELKARITDLKCHSDDEVAFRHIIRMLDAKSLERGAGVVEDPQLHFALVSAGAMEFRKDYTFVPQEETSRGLLASGFGLLRFF